MSKDQTLPFFQSKLTISQHNDKYEKESDAVADAVVNQTTAQPVLQAKNISSIQRYMKGGKTEGLDTSINQIRDNKIIQKKEIEQDKDDNIWKRKLDSPPYLLDGRKPSYQVDFNHIIPTPYNSSAKQVWQVVEIDLMFINKDCELKEEKRFIIDIVDIGVRKEIFDTWGYIPNKDHCFVREIASATVGFDNGKENYAEQSKELGSSIAEKILQTMTGPIGYYAGEYSFIKPENCPDCGKLKEFEHTCCAAPEYLHVEGVGEWPESSKGDI